MTIDQPSSMALVLLIFAILIFAGIGWCIISSCVGKPILRFFSGLWEASMLSARVGASSSTRRRKALARGESELWEMEFRGRSG